MYGIEKLKDVGADLAKFGMKIEEALEDKKLNWAEALSLGVFAVPKALKHVGDAEQIKNEFRDLRGPENDELVNHIATELDLDADNVEAVVEAGFEALVALNNLRVTIRAAKPE